MSIRNIIIGVFSVVLLVLLIGVLAVLIASAPEVEGEKSPSVFSVSEFGVVGDSGYAVFNYRGNGNITALSYDSEPKLNIYVINDSQAIETSRLSELVKQLKTLEKYGYSVSVGNATTIGDAIYVVPTGAMPSYVLFNLQQNSSNGTIIYIGAKDLVFSSGIQRYQWYNSLTPQQLKRLAQYDGTLDEFLQSGNTSLADDLLHLTWAQQRNYTLRLNGDGLQTATINLGNATHLRLIYDFEDIYGVVDSPPMATSSEFLIPKPASIFPWEKSSLEFSLNKTNGTAFLSIKKDGKEIQHELLRRVTDANVFIQKLQYSEPGEYTIQVIDNSGVIASGLLHVKDLKINLIGKQGVSYIFAVTLDGNPLKNAEVLVSLGNSSTKKKLFITDGTLTVNAKLEKGTNIFNVEFFGNTISVPVVNNADPIFDFYLKYGLPGVAIIALVYFGVRISKKPVYSLRFGDSMTYIREEVRISLPETLETFKKSREDLHLGKSPITPHEFSIALKRHVTNGADITEGNIEGILKKLVVSGHLENHREYYQLRGEGDVKKNTLRRMIREKLIENGIPFKESGYRFTTKDYDLSLFGEQLAKKTIIVVDDDSEAKELMAGLDQQNLAKLKIKQANDLITIVPIDRLSGAL